VDIERYVAEHPKLHLKRSGTRGQYRGWCPFHPEGNYDCFSINTQTGLWLCRSARCGLRGSFPLFYKLLEGIRSWAEVRSTLRIHDPIRTWEDLLTLTTSQEAVPQSAFQPLPPDAFQAPLRPDFFPAYLVGRGFGLDILPLGFDLRWCWAGDYRGRLLLPYYDLDGQLVTFSARSMANDGDHNGHRYRFPDGATTNRFLYGVWRTAYHERIERFWVVEGPFDALRLATFGELAVALSTNAPSTRQKLDIVRLAQLYQADVLVCLDRGALDKTHAIWAELRAFGLRRAFAIDISQTAKDPGEVRSSDQIASLLGQVPIANREPSEVDRSAESF
jgi:hypothetical protein